MPELDQNRINEILNISRNIQGWCNPVGGVLLYVIGLLYAPNNTFVELGSWKGTSTVWLANALKDRQDEHGRLYAVDTWEGTPAEEVHKELLKNYRQDQLYNEFIENMSNAGVSKFINR